MSTPTPQITDAAREAASNEIDETESYVSPIKRGHFVQQLLDEERGKWEKERKDPTLYPPKSFLTAPDCFTQSCGHNSYWRSHYGNCMACARLAAEQERDQLRQQLTEAQAAIAVQNRKALMCDWFAKWIWESRWVSEESLYQDIVGVAAEVRSGNYQRVENEAQALSPNCGQPLLELVRDAKKTLEGFHHEVEAHGFCEPENKCSACIWLTKAAQLGV